MAASVINGGLVPEAAPSASPAKVIPTGTVTIPFISEGTVLKNGEALAVAKVPAGAYVTEIDILHVTALGGTAKISVGVEYQASTDTGTNVTTEAAKFRVAAISNTANAKLAIIAGQLPYVVPATAKSDASIIIAGTTNNSAESIYKGHVTYTLQTSERFVPSADQ